MPALRPKSPVLSPVVSSRPPPDGFSGVRESGGAALATRAPRPGGRVRNPRGSRNPRDPWTDTQRRRAVTVPLARGAARRPAPGRRSVAHNRATAAAWRPQYKEAARRIARALRELVDANRAEHEIQNRAPNGTLISMDFPNVGQLGAVGGPAKFWMEHARRHGYLEEDDGAAQFPAAAL